MDGVTEFNFEGILIDTENIKDKLRYMIMKFQHNQGESPKLIVMSFYYKLAIERFYSLYPYLLDCGELKKFNCINVVSTNKYNILEVY